MARATYRQGDAPPSTEHPGRSLAGEMAGVAGPGVEETVTAGRRRRASALVASYAVTVFVLVTINFSLPRAMPGDPISALVEPGAGNYVENEVLRAELEEHYGLDRPLVEQYGRYLADLAQLDFGVSIRYNAPVSELIAERLPWTLLLYGTALVIATVVGVAIGVHSAWRRGRPLDQGLLALFLGLHNLPVFFVGSLALIVFAVHLDWFPLAGTSTPFNTGAGLVERAADVAHHLFLPASVIALGFSAPYYLVMRASMVSELGADYLMLGRAKGLGERRLKYRYAGRNALLPVVTLSALRLEYLVTAGVLVETVFAYKGMGRLLFEAVSFRDYPTLQACFLILTLVVVTANFLADAAYGRLDPRTATA